MSSNTIFISDSQTNIITFHWFDLNPKVCREKREKNPKQEQEKWKHFYYFIFEPFNSHPLIAKLNFICRPFVLWSFEFLRKWNKKETKKSWDKMLKDKECRTISISTNLTFGKCHFFTPHHYFFFILPLILLFLTEFFSSRLFALHHFFFLLLRVLLLSVQLLFILLQFDFRTKSWDCLTKWRCKNSEVWHAVMRKRHDIKIFFKIK